MTLDNPAFAQPLLAQSLVEPWVSAVVLLLCVAAIPSLYFADWIKERSRRRRCRAGICLRCGYDATHSEYRCSECGADLHLDRVIYGYYFVERRPH
jgi:hypothetical protein